MNSRRKEDKKKRIRMEKEGIREKLVGVGRNRREGFG